MALYSCSALEKTGLPDSFEGKRKYAKAQKALDAIQESPVAVIPYEQLKEQYAKKGRSITIANAFETAGEEICRHIQRILAERKPPVIE